MLYMANIAYRRKRKNNTGSYDTVYYETDSRIVIRPNGESVEDSLKKNVYVRPNLLDNWYFVGGGSQLGNNTFPINQKGKTEYTNDTTFYNSIDRWRYPPSANIKILDDCLQISDTNTRNDPSFSQFHSKTFKAGRYTISALCKCTNKVNDNVFLNLWTGTKWATENFEFQYNYKVSDTIDLIFVTIDIDEDTVPNNCYCTLFAMGNTTDLYAMKFEEGDVQTLAWKDDKEQWHLFEIPDYVTEFTKCQRYLSDITPKVIFNASYIAVCTESGRLYTTIPLPVQMRLTLAL